MRIGPLWVGPPWERMPADALAVVIDPGRAFGTGAHPTTRLCLELLLEEEPAACSTSAAARACSRSRRRSSGYAPVIAVDVDESAVSATLANAERNEVDVDARLVDATASPLPPAQLALANIALGAVEQLAGRIDAARIVTSGYLVSEGPALDGFRRVGRRELDGWAADVHARA